MSKKSKSTELVVTPSSGVTKRVTLRSLAITIKSDVCELYGTMRQSVDVIIRIGERLYEARALAKHGQWLPWLKENVGMSDESARLYMRAYDQREKLLQPGHPVTSLRKALQILGIRKPAANTGVDDPSPENPADVPAEPVKVEIIDVKVVEREPPLVEDHADASSALVPLLTTTAESAPIALESAPMQTDVTTFADPAEHEYCITGACIVIAGWQDALLSAIQSGTYPADDLPMLVAAIEKALPVLQAIKAAANQRIESKTVAAPKPRRSLRDQLVPASRPVQQSASTGSPGR